MSSYSEKLSLILEREKKLKEEKDKLIQSRKLKITQLIEQFNLLDVSDTCLAGAFYEIQTVAQTGSERMSEWEKVGKRFLKSKSSKTDSTASSAA